MDTTTSTTTAVPGGSGWRRAPSRALAASLAALLVWTGVAPGIAAAQDTGGQPPVVVQHEPLTTGVAGEPLRIEARITSSGTRPFVVLHHRTEGESAYRDDFMPRVGAERYLRELPTEAGTPTRIEYWIEASADGAAAAAGSADAPIVVDVTLEAAPPPAVADARAPEIADVSPAAAPAGERQRFAVEVTDDTDVAEVVLFHRAAGGAEFEPLPMSAEGGNRYVAALPSAADTTLIEYFVEARDPAGNRESLGSRFMALERSLEVVASAPAVAPAPAPEPVAEARSNTLWYVLGGVLLVGAIAAAAGGGGEEEDTGDCCTVTIEVDAPQ